MQLDKFTEKAQAAVVAAQELAERLQSPILDAEHLLAALVEPDDGIPAETLRRLGVSLVAFRGELAAALPRHQLVQAARGVEALDGEVAEQPALDLGGLDGGGVDGVGVGCGHA